MLTKCFVKIMNTSEAKGIFGTEWYLSYHPVLNPNKPGKIHCICNSAAKYKYVCLNDKLLAWPDLLYGLVGTIFRFWVSRGTKSPNCRYWVYVFASADSWIRLKLLAIPVATNNERTCADLRISTSYFWCKEFTHMCKLRSKASSNCQCGRFSNCSKGNPKQLLHGQLHQVSRHSWWSNRCFQAIATSSVEAWIRTEKMDHQLQ